MLNLTLPKIDVTPVASRGTVASDVVAEIDLQEASGLLTTSTACSYRSAIRLLARKLNRPVESCSVDMDDFERRFPLDGFDPDWHKNEVAYGTWRNRAAAGLKIFFGIAQAKRQRREIEDNWTRLFAVIEPFTKEHPTRWTIAPQKLIAVKRFADTCRQHRRQPHEIDRAFMCELEGLYSGNQRGNHRAAAPRLDEWRNIAEALPLLPPIPIEYEKEDYPKPQDIPSALVEQVESWIIATTETNWDPVTEENTAKHDGHAHIARAAFRTYLRAALSIGVLDPHANCCLPVFIDGDRAVTVVRQLLTRTDLPRKKGGLSRRSLRKYLKVIVQVLRHVGQKPTVLEQALKANPTLNAGAKDDKTMTPENQKFCQRLLDRKDLRARFLTSYHRVREAAEDILAIAAADGRDLTKRERSRVIILGMCAAFAAIEIAGAPLRVENVLEAPMYGDGAWFRVPEKGNGQIKVHIPAAFTKAKIEDIEFWIRKNAFGGLATILWYVRVIRPLVPGSKDNIYLFPSPKTSGACVTDSWFRDEFKNATRSIVDLPMLPHQFRHGQASLLLNKHPGEIVVIAKRTGHTVAALLRYYAFLDAIKAMERGQDMMFGLMDD